MRTFFVFLLVTKLFYIIYYDTKIMSISSKGKHLLRQWLSHPLPMLTQGSTLQIVSKIPKTNLSIRSQWRDDGKLSMVQQQHQQQRKKNQQQEQHEEEEAEVVISKQKDKMTSMGRDESHILIQLRPKKHHQQSLLDLPSSSSSSSSSSLPTAQYKRSNDPPPSSPSLPDAKKVILDDGTILPDSKEWSDPKDGYKRIEYSDDVAHITKKDDNTGGDDGLDHNNTIGRQSNNNNNLWMEVTVPEKVNLDCNLSEGGNIVIHDKIEGDVRINTTNGNVKVKKLRGHAIHIHAQGIGNSISSSDLLEAESLNIDLPMDDTRLRAKRIHANTCNVTIGSGSGRRNNNKTNQDVNIMNNDDGDEEKEVSSPRTSLELFDDDDSGAICDISSLYVTGEAFIHVDSKGNSSKNNCTTQQQAVRVKSNHGHVTVDASGPKPPNTNSNDDSSLPPLVDLGGVNGSCEVFLSGYDKDNNDNGDDGYRNINWVSGRVHFDSLSSDSVSVIQADVGNLNITVDRKVESDLRMVSTSNSDTASKLLDVDILVEDDEKEINDMLMEMDKVCTTRTTKDRKIIQIKTKAFTSKTTNGDDDCSNTLNLTNCEYVNGWIENKSEEPDSRFDRKIRGGGGSSSSSSSSGSVGKIRLQGAHDQALQSFQGKGGQKDNNSSVVGSNFQRPLLVVTSTGEIILETLSWLGNIARRYGFDDSRKDEQHLGRTATRRGRTLVEPSKE